MCPFDTDFSLWSSCAEKKFERPTQPTLSVNSPMAPSWPLFCLSPESFFPPPSSSDRRNCLSTTFFLFRDFPPWLNDHLRFFPWDLCLPLGGKLGLNRFFHLIFFLTPMPESPSPDSHVYSLIHCFFTLSFFRMSHPIKAPLNSSWVEPFFLFGLVQNLKASSCLFLVLGWDSPCWFLSWLYGKILTPHPRPRFSHLIAPPGY